MSPLVRECYDASIKQAPIADEDLDDTKSIETERDDDEDANSGTDLGSECYATEVVVLYQKHCI